MLEILSLLTPLGGGAIAGMLKSIIEARNAQQMLLLSKLGLDKDDRARATALKDEGVSFTRRYIAILFSTAFVGIVVLVTWLGLTDPDFTINMPYQDFENSWLSKIGLTEPRVVDSYVTLHGFTLVQPLIEKLMFVTEAIVGFYFGARANIK